MNTYPKITDVKFTYSAEPKEINDILQVTGDPAFNTFFTERIHKQQQEGDQWAYALATVTASWDGLSAKSSPKLGIWANKFEFIGGESCPALKQEAYHALLEELEKRDTTTPTP